MIRRPTVHAVARASLLAVEVGAVAGLVALAVASQVVRRVVTPEEEGPDDAWLLEVRSDARPPAVVLRADEESLRPGRYGLLAGTGGGHLRVAEVLDRDERTVTRRLVAVDAGTPRPGSARWSGYWVHGGPRGLGLPTRDVHIPSGVGPLPAWEVPGSDPDRWAVLVHGRGALRDECLRAVRPLHEVGAGVLVPSYRNDREAPPSLDGRYGLGLREWEDVQEAMAHCLQRGARELLLMGWSMGGAIVLQTLNRSPLAEHVTGVVLDGPVVSWADVIRHHGELNHLPGPVSVLARTLAGHRWAHRLAGLREPLDLPLTDWVTRADELAHPVMLIHSRADETVPSGPSEELARRRPDLVRLELWEDAAHCREWNTDPRRWERLVREFCAPAGQ